MKIKTTILTIWLFIVSWLPMDAAAQVYSTSIISPSASSGIHTLMVRDMNATEPYSVQNPVWVLGDTEQRFEISFDELSHDPHSYSYTLKMLNADGSLASLSPNEYIDGANYVDIADQELSFNTQQLYTHYRFQFPSDEMRPLLSGNYALIIYEDGREDQLRAIVRLAVVEPKVSIRCNLTYNTAIELSGRYQQLDIDVQTSGVQMQNPDEIKLVVEQNGRTDNRAFAPRPTFISPGTLTWTNCRSLIFEGGNEYRRLDIGSEYLMGVGVDQVRFDHAQQAYHAYLFPSDNLSGVTYQTEPDMDGAYIVNRERSSDDDIEADYMWVHFFFPAENPWLDGTLYVLGDAWFNQLVLATRMRYEVDSKAYIYSCYLKQGGYNWQYAFLTKSAREKHLGATLERTEGSHWQTRNTYRIFVYHRPFGSRSDRLIGYKEIKN